MFRKNPKRTWDLLKEATTGKCSHKPISEITTNAGTITDPTLIAEEFNKFFSNIGSKIVSTITPSNIDPLSYIPNNPNVPLLAINHTGPSQIIDLLKSFDSKPTTDLDEISIKLLKFVSHEIAVPLAHIFNLSISLGIFPNKFKTARVVPVYKAGDPLSCDNYRPIALVKSFSKILEKIVQINLVNHLEINKLLFPHQYGFLKNKSTEHTLLHIVNHISESLNAGNYTIGVFLDLKKAFDVVNHDILLAKLPKYGIADTALDWFRSYLSGRSQIVDINNNLSQSRSVDMSVIQGSLLGPTLFLIFINDFPNCTSLQTYLFADDTSALKSGPNLNDLFSSVNDELCKIAAWYRANKMSANASKTKYIIFHNKGKPANTNGLDLYFNDNEPHDILNPTNIHTLERIHNNNPNSQSRSYKLLGIHLDENLSLNHHFSILSSKLSRALFFLRRAKNLLPPNALHTLYYSLFHCHLSYCPNILGTSSNSNISKIARLQRKAIRIITVLHPGSLFMSGSISIH
jgi:retron-type reverse transcriptase